jgi:iron complex outermembrane receptor protein
MKSFIIVLFLIGLPLTLLGQHSVSGIVYDENQEPLPGTEIYIEELHIGTTADLDGSYVLKNIPSGNHKLTFSFIGYSSFNAEIFIAEEDISLDVTLEPSLFHMDEVIVSAPFSKLQSENVMKIESRTLASLRKQGAPTLVQSLTAIPGVSEVSTGNGIGKPVIRGLSGNRVLVYTQGVRLENQQYGQEHGLGLNASGIESVEVIKGPASLLYGSDALGGVLYVNPEKFAFQDETQINAGQTFFSNTLGSNTTAGVKTSKDQFKMLLRGGYNTHSDYEIPNGDRVTNTRYREVDFKAGLGMNLDNFVTELRYNYNKSDIGIPEEIAEQSSSKNMLLPFQDLTTHILSLHNHFFLNRSKFEVNLGYIMNRRKEYEGGHEHGHEDHDHESEEGHESEEDHESEEGHESEEDHESEEGHDASEAALFMDLKTFTYDVKYHLPTSERFETIVGMQGMWQSNENFGEEILIPDAITNDLGLLVNTSFEINENHTLQGGLRFDHRSIETEAYALEHHEDHEHHEEHEDEMDEDEMEEDHDEEAEIVDAIDRSFSNMTFSVGYKTSLFGMISTRINFASGFRAPNLAELTSYGVHHGTNRFEVGNPDLESERNFQTDISLEYRNRHIEIYVNGFYNILNNYIYLSPTGEEMDDAPVFDYVQNDAKLYGSEFGIHLHPHPVDWLHLESNFEMVIGELNEGGYLPLIPANKWSNTLRGEFKGWQRFNEVYLAVTMDSFFDQNKVSDFETETPGYNLVNFGLGGDISFEKWSLGLRLSLNNAFNETYISHLSRLKFNGIPNPGRNFTFGLNFNI